MSVPHGKDSYLSIDNPAGTPTDISAFCDASTFQRMRDLAEITTFGSAAKKRIVGLTDGKISASGPWDPALDAVLGTDPAAGASRSYIYGPAGSTTGFVKYTGELHVSNYQIDNNVDGEVTWSADFDFTDAFTRGVF